MGNQDEPWPNPNQPNVTDAHCVLCGKATTHQRRPDGILECVACRVRLQVEAERAAASGMAMRFCAACGGSTHHDAYGCVRCRQAHAIVAGERHRRASHTARNVTLGALLAVAIIGSGFFHCTYGGHHGFDVVQKEEWGYYDQFVDMDSIEGQPIITLLGRARTVRALLRAGVISLPPELQQ
jgi:hypothetical protein